MIDVSAILLAAAQDAGRWSRSDVRRVCDAMSRVVGGRWDWDEDAGEDWARVLRGDRLAGIVSRLLPLAIVTDDLPDPGSPNRPAVAVISVTAMDDPVLSCDPKTLDDIFGARLPGPPIFDPQRFSADDIWYATV